jgi:hypothetical protein
LIGKLHPDVVLHDSGGWITYESRLNRLRDEFDALSPQESPDHGPPHPLLHHFRSSPVSLWQAGLVLSREDPGLTRPGMSYVVLDAEATLLLFLVVPEYSYFGEEGRREDSTSGVEELIRAAGFEPNELRPVEPSLTPPVYVAERLAWVPASEGAALPGTRMEAGLVDGRPMYFELAPGGVELRRPAKATRDWSSYVFGPLLLVGILLAWRNYRLDRIDRRGALRLGFFGFATHLAFWLQFHHPAGAHEAYRSFLNGAGYSLRLGASIYVFYLALEPFVRKRWPHALISWTRLLSGRWSDPWVGRDVLAGLSSMGVVVLLGIAESEGRRALGLPVRFEEMATMGLEGIATAMAHVVHFSGDAVMASAGFALLLVLLRMLLRSTWAAAVLWVVICTAVSPYRAISVQIVVFFMILAVLYIRLGILAMTIMLFTAVVMVNLPFTLDTSSWLFPQSLAVIGTLVGLALWALRTSTRGQKALGEAP